MKKRIISVVALVLVVAMLSVVLVACAPKTVDDAKTKLAKKYDVVGGSQDIIVVGGLKGMLTATNKENANIMVTAFYYEDAEKAKAAYSKIEADYESYKADLKNKIKNEKDEEKKADLQAALDASKIKQSGQWIAFGHKKAVGALFGL